MQHAQEHDTGHRFSKGRQDPIALPPVRRSVFVNAWVGVDNSGDELIFERLRARLSDLGTTSVTVTSFNPRETELLHGVKAVHPRHLVAIVRAIKHADLFVIGPGGLLQDSSSPWNLPYQLHRALIARVLRVPVLGMGLGADPMTRCGSGLLLRLALGRSVAVAVRDDVSRMALDAHRVEATTTADLAVGAAPLATDPDGEAIVVSLRPRRRRGLLPVRWQRRRLDDAQVEAAATVLDKLAVELKAPVRFVAFEPRTDQPLHEAVASRMTSPASCVTPSPGKLVAEMADAQVVIATRYHAGITALVAARPTVLIGYAPKVKSLAAATGMPLLADTDEALAALADACETAQSLDSRPALAALQAAEARNGEIIARALGRDA